MSYDPTASDGRGLPVAHVKFKCRFYMRNRQSAPANAAGFPLRLSRVAFAHAASHGARSLTGRFPPDTSLTPYFLI